MAKIEKFEDIEACQKAPKFSKAIYKVEGNSAFSRERSPLEPLQEIRDFQIGDDEER